jgi:glycosyltransferase involved in cell wall biosynthesis
MTSLKKGISIIVCCYNSKDRLPKTLEYLSKQNLDKNHPVEIIIVDNNSSDNTGLVARELWNDYGAPYPIVVIEEKEPGLSNARRAGVKLAQYEYGIFCDDDNWLSEDYLKQTIELFEDNPRAGVLGGASAPVFDADLPPWFYTKAGSFAVGIQADENGDLTWRQFVWGAGMSFRIDVLKAIYKEGIEPLVSDRKGNVLTSGGDGEISAWFIFAGYRLFYSNTLFFKHYMPPERLTDEYFNNFFKRSYPTDWATYSSYLTTKYMLLRKGSGFAKTLLSILKILYSLGYLLVNFKSTLRVIKVESKIKKLTGFSQIRSDSGVY